MKKVPWIIAISVLLQTTTVFAEPTTGDMMDMLQKIQKQMSDMQRTIDNQNFKIQQLESRKVLETPQPNVPIQPSATMSDEDFQKSLKDNIGEAIPWMKGAKYGGDLRLRMENFNYYNKNDEAGSTGTTADRPRSRFRIRLRWGFEKDYGDDWKAGFRLATGSTTDPNSTNVSLGNPGYFNFKTFNVDRAYAIYEPNGLKDYGALKGAKVGAGKFENPFLRYSTPMVWDADVTPEGLYEQANWQLVNAEDTKVKVQTTAGQFIVNENAGVDTDAEIFAYQGALNISTYAFNSDKPTDISLAMSYYDYYNWFQTVTSNTASTSYLRTNSILADDFRVLDLYPEVVMDLNGSPLTLWVDYAVNTSNVGTTNDQSLGNDVHDSDTAWGAGFKLGKANKKSSWEFFYGYYEIGVNAVPAAFNDGDFGGPGTNGFTNRKGHKFGLGYMLTENIALNWTGYLVAPLHPTASSTLLGLGSATNESVFRSQLDLVYKF